MKSAIFHPAGPNVAGPAYYVNPADNALPREPIRAWKLLRVRRDGSLTPLFINRQQTIPLNQWLPAEDHPTTGYQHRPGWHAAPRTVTVHEALPRTESGKVKRRELRGRARSRIGRSGDRGGDGPSLENLRLERIQQLRDVNAAMNILYVGITSPAERHLVLKK